MEFDHLVVAAEHLDQAVDYVETELGITLIQGGKHARYGTHNAVAAIGAHCYIEAIARDYEASKPQVARWFDLDRFEGAPRIITWACRVGDLHSALVQLPAQAGTAVEMTRAAFRWKINVAPSGRMMHDGAFPQLLEWEGGQHPCHHLPSAEVELTRLSVTCAHAAEVTQHCPQLADDPRIDVISGRPLAFRADFDTPSGTKTLLG